VRRLCHDLTIVEALEAFDDDAGAADDDHCRIGDGVGEGGDRGGVTGLTDVERDEARVGEGSPCARLLGSDRIEAATGGRGRA
jgi:hypothetical protein